MNPIVPRFARAPVPKPVPVVMNDVVPVWPARSRTLPEVVIEPGRRFGRLSPANRVAVVCVPTARVIDPADQSGLYLFDSFDHSGPRTALAPHLNYSPVFSSRLDQELSFAGIMTARLLNINML